MKKIMMSQLKGVWWSSATSEKKLSQAFQEEKSVILFFSVYSSGSFQVTTQLKGILGGILKTHYTADVWCELIQVQLKRWCDWVDHRNKHHRCGVFIRALHAWPRTSSSRIPSGKDVEASSALTGSVDRMSPFRAPSTLATCGTTTRSKPAEMTRSLSPVLLSLNNSVITREFFIGGYQDFRVDCIDKYLTQVKNEANWQKPQTTEAITAKTLAGEKSTSCVTYR